MAAKDFFAFAKKHGSDMVDLKFTDLLGTWQHCSFPIETWIEYKMANEVNELRLRPHPYEFYLYYDN